MEENKHYIRLDLNNYIIKGFSDAFEQPIETDICIDSGGRHFELNEVINPNLFSSDGVPLYKWDGLKIVNLTDTDIQNFKASLPKVVQPPTIEDLQKQIFELTSQLVSKGVV